MSKAEILDNMTGDEIAVIGMACRFPGAQNVDEFWDNLEKGIESIHFFSDEELDEMEIGPDMLNHPGFVRSKGGVLEGEEFFDASFFDYSAVEASAMDPQMRIFHECVWEAMEHAGYPPGAYNGLIGLYAGASNSAGLQPPSSSAGGIDGAAMFADTLLRDKDFLCTRISHKLNLKGPSVSVHTACSTSLVAIHMACQAILNAECSMALAGGISISAFLEKGYTYQEGMIFSPDGHCRAFDAKAKGTTGGSGAGVVVLKALEAAINDGDTIHALVKGTAINNDGLNKSSFTAPSREGQSDVIRMTHQVAEIEAESISYVECHGTGTPLGDPIEIEALKQAFDTEKRNFCAVGSVKTNIGHLNTAAGVAGFIKTVLALKHRLIPPTLHFDAPNPNIDFDNSPFYVNQRLKEWKADTYPLRAGISSFGIGGTNAHVVLEEAPKMEKSRENRKWKLLLLSAKTKPSLDRAVNNLLEYLKENPGINLSDAAYTFQVGRKDFPHRASLVCSSVEEAVAALTQSESGETGIPTWFSGADEKPKIVFMFPGQGSQYLDMGRRLLETESSFREDVEHCFGILKTQTGMDIKKILYPGSNAGMEAGKEKINRTAITQPVIFVFEYALARLLMRWGIKPDAMIGHSIGEYTAACLSGVFPLEDALSLVHYRGKSMQSLSPGAMLSISLPEEEVAPLLNHELSLAAVNAPSLSVVSGSFKAIEEFEEQLKKKQHNYRRLHTSHAFHSEMMTPILKEFEETVREIKLGPPKIPFISNLSGQWISAEDAMSPGYWARHIRETVRFADGLTELLKEEEAVFLEVGPGNTLSTFTRQHKDKKPQHAVVDLVRRPNETRPDDYVLLRGLGKLWGLGIKIDWSRFHAGQGRRRITMPTYSFDRQKYARLLIEPFVKEKRLAPSTQAVARKEIDIGNWFYLPQWTPSLIIQDDKAAIPSSSSFLIFLDEIGVGKRLAQQLKKEGENVITVSTGSEFAKIDQLRYRLNPRHRDDYNLLFRDINAAGYMPGKILHLWGVTGNNSREETLLGQVNEALDMGFYSLLYIAKAIDREKDGNDIQITVITDNMQEVTGQEILNPGKATVIAPVKVIPQEYPNILCRGIDIEVVEPGSWQEERLLSQLLAEVRCCPVDAMVAYRGHRRSIQSYQRQRIEKPDTCPGLLKENGVYLITGGLGLVGLNLAKYLASTVKARLILVGRSVFPSREEWQEWLDSHDETNPASSKIRKLLEIEELGGEVLLLCADVADKEQMNKTLKEAERCFGTINGVVHAAGIVRDIQVFRSTIAEVDEKLCEEQFHPKIYGTLVLKELLESRELDFCSLTSSLSSVLGGMGYIAYAAGNLFMDSFVQQHNRTTPRPWTSVNWEGWMPEAERLEELRNLSVGTTLSEQAVTPEEGTEAFARTLSPGAIGNIVVSAGDLESRLDKWVKIKLKKEEDISTSEVTSVKHSRPALPSSYVPARNKIEQALVSIWQDFFGIDGIGILDDFFELGGDSLQVSIVSVKIHKELKVKLPIQEFFNNPTIKKIAEYISNSVEQKTCSTIEPVEEREYYTLSSAQKRIYVVSRMEPESTAYNTPVVKLLEGELDKEALELAFKKLIVRHETYRTAFELHENEPVQKIRKEVDFKIQEYYLPPGAEHEGLDENLQRIIKQFIKPFDLRRAPLLRVGLVRINRVKHLFMLDMPHIISDGISAAIFIREMMGIYKGEELPVLNIQYKDFAQWQRHFSYSDEMKKQENYWLKKFEDTIPILKLTTDFPRPENPNFDKGAFIDFVLEDELNENVHRLVKDTGATLFILLMAVYNIFLLKYTGQEDFVVGVPVTGRPHPDLQNIIGVFINMLPMRNRPGRDKSFKEFLMEVKADSLKDFENQDYQLEELIRKLGLQGNSTRNPLFDTEFSMYNIQLDENWIPGLKLVPYDSGQRFAKFDLHFLAKEIDGAIDMVLQYSTELFMESTAEKMIRHYIEILEQVVGEPDILIKDISISHELTVAGTNVFREEAGSFNF